ncbi:MAG: CocE/NonD family hydrolase [Phenylobacterium sp.]|uniref:CocE/NonD family hydrolase n=1 Tax=Phenylobacterium sp. TaxID=1871053 RepID=UPI0027374E9E|nr:CocE/NonD family hydrolase [Phenylobacterium sp.]MDP3748629.1 CocE/NonD family hydrolase [Phenylobacterium sp.]
MTEKLGTQTPDTGRAPDGTVQGSPKVAVDFDVPARMRDGNVLRANVYRPEGAGPWPVLLARLPYFKDSPMLASVLDPVQTAHRGFMVVVQDTRGRFASEGEWEPFRYEREDGFDSVEWAARLPGSNGRVGMFGGSYFGNTQWMAAIQRPPSLAAISPMVTWCDPMDGLFARGGAVELGLELAWTLQTGAAYLLRLPISEEERARRLVAIVAEYDSLPTKGYWDLPVKTGEIQGHQLPSLGAIPVLTNPDVATWCRVAGNHQRVTVPTFHTAGWYDVFLQGTLDNFRAMRDLGRDARLVVGPWSHGEFGDAVGDLRFGLPASRVGAAVHPYGDVNDFQLAWFGQHLKSDSSVELPEPRVRLFVMGRNAWRDENEWPLQRAEIQRHHLRADGSLTTAGPAADEGATEFLYDPSDPVPTVGGQTVMMSAFPSGPKEQARVEARPDVCVFTSEPLDEEFEVTGRVRVVLHAVSSAPSTDWVARLCDVHPDGRSYNLCDGIVRTGQNASSVGCYEVDLWSTSNVFLPGHRIRVHVTSSSFPRWDRNLNTGDQDSPRHQVAQQRLFHDADRPSFIELPVIR